MRVTVIPFLISVLETILKNTMAWYGKLSLPAIFGSAQLSAIPGTVHVLLKVLFLWAAGMLLRHGWDYPENNKELDQRGSHNSNNNNNNNNNNNGNFICVFECTIIIVNLAPYRQFTNTAWDWIIPKKKKEEKKIKIALILGYPN